MTLVCNDVLRWRRGGSVSELSRGLLAVARTTIVGYATMARRDPPRARRVLADYTARIKERLCDFSGELVREAEDGFVLCFPSALQAIECAMALQRPLGSRTPGRNRDQDQGQDEDQAALTDDRRYKVRIGADLGEVVWRDGTPSGEALTVAARIEPLAPAGGICITRAVYEQIYNKADARFVSLGKRELAGGMTSVELYRIVWPGEALDASSRDAERTRIAVLPFQNISPDPNDTYLTDGMTEELIYTLSKEPQLRVVAHTSVMRFRDRRTTVADIGRDLRVGTVIEGSIRKAGNRLRITAQMVDTTTQEPVWSQSYDRELTDLFEIQTDISRRITDQLRDVLVDQPCGSLAASHGTETRSAQRGSIAQELYLRGKTAWLQWNEDGLDDALDLFRGAIEADPDWALPYSALADTYSLMAQLRLIPAEVGYESARAAAQQALALDDRLAEAHASLAMTELLSGEDIARAEAELERALELNPSLAVARHWHAVVLGAAGRVEDALAESQKAWELDPDSPLFQAAAGRLLDSTSFRSTTDDA